MFDNCLTSGLESKVETQIIYLPMNEKEITIREFLRNHKKYTDKKKTIIITKNGKPKGVYIPYDKWEKKKKKHKFNIKDLEEITFSTGDPGLSQKIDEICYPYPNKLKNDNS